MADTFNGAAEDFGDLKDDDEDEMTLANLEGAPVPDPRSEDDDDGDASDGNAADDESGKAFDNPLPEDSDVADPDPNAFLHMAEDGDDFENDEFDTPRQPGMPARTHVSDTTEDAGMQETGEIGGGSAEEPDGMDAQQTAPQSPYGQWPPDPSYVRPSAPPQAPGFGYQQNTDQGDAQQWGYQQTPVVQAAPMPGQWAQTQDPAAAQQESWQTARQYQETAAPRQDDRQTEQGQQTPAASQQETWPAPGQDSGYADAQTMPTEPEENGYADPEAQQDQDEPEPAALDDDIPAVSKEIPEVDMIAKIISLADSIRQDMDKDERAALRKILDVPDPDYADDGMNESSMDTASMVFASLRMHRSFLDAFDELLEAQDKDASEQAFYLIRLLDPDLRTIIAICRKFVDDDRKPDQSQIHVSLAEIAAHCLSLLDDNDIKLLKSARGTLGIAREVAHG